MPIGALALAAAPAIIGGAASIFGARNANKARRKEGKKNRAFQERMRNTQWQAGVADMEKAGLNPALAYNQGGAASPSGSLPSQEDEISGGVTSAMEAKRLTADLKQIDQQTRLLLAQEYSTDQSARESRAREQLIDKQAVGTGWNNELVRLQIPGAKNISQFEKGAGGEMARNIRMWRETLIGGGSPVQPIRLRR